MDKPPPEILAAFGLGAADMIGAGGQSWVYALDTNRVLRLLRHPKDQASLGALADFLAGIDGQLPFATPVIEEIGPGGAWTIERRLPGTSMTMLLTRLAGNERTTAIGNHVAAAEAVGRITFRKRPFGQMLADPALVAPRWRDYLRLDLDRFIAANAASIAATIGGVEDLRRQALLLLDEVAEPRKTLVHGDFVPGNVLLDQELAVSGLVDFSAWTVVGDRLLDIAGAAIFLEMVGQATDDDAALARRIVLDRHGPGIIPAARFYRAYAAFAMADPGNSGGLYPKLFPWAIANLAALRDGTIGF